MQGTTHVALTLAFAALIAAQPPGVVVFLNSSEGYHTFRIPTLAAFADTSTLLAFAEGRARLNFTTGDTIDCYGEGASAFDWKCTNKDVVLKRSLTGGLTWLPVQVLAPRTFSQTHSPSSPPLALPLYSTPGATPLTFPLTATPSPTALPCFNGVRTWVQRGAPPPSFLPACTMRVALGACSWPAVGSSSPLLVRLAACIAMTVARRGPLARAPSTWLRIKLQRWRPTSYS